MATTRRQLASRSSQAKLPLPHPVGPYRLERVLGRGGMGIVYAAYDQRLERRVAVKRIHLGSSDPTHRERLRREARTTAQLAHPAIIQVFDLIEDRNCDWIVMELVEGTTLANLVKSGPLDVDLTLRFAEQIADGLAAAHDLGIVHRDLKTDNVMVLPSSRVKILDFGIAKRLDFAVDRPIEKSLSKPGEVVGTSRAMAPEQARGLRVGPRSDLFSFGVLLYEMLTGLSPFRAKSPVETLSRVLTHQPVPVRELAPEVPSPLSDLVERLLRKAPELRPASAGEVAEKIAEILESVRAESRDEVAGATDETAATVGTGLPPVAPDSLPPEPPSVQKSTRAPARSPSAFSERAAPWVVSLAILGALVLVALLRERTVAAPESSGPGVTIASPPVADDPLHRYEEGMRSLRRTDRPENVDRAITTFRGLINRDGGSAAAHAGLARAYWEKARSASAGGDPVFLEQALALAEEAVRLGAYLADAHASLGLVHYSRGLYPEAAAEFDLALELDANHADSHYGLGKLAEVQGQLERAEHHYQKAAALDPEPLFLDTLGALLYDRGHYGDAEVAFLESLTLAPDNVHALRNLGSLYYTQGRLDEAAERFQAALKIRPNASLYSNLGTLFFSRGLYSKAAAAFEQALRTDGAANRFIFWLNLGDAYRQIPGKEADAEQKYRRAIQILNGTIEAAPSDVRLLSRRALALARVGDLPAARQELERLKESGTETDLYSLLRIAVAEELCGEREEALASLDQALRSGLPISEARHEPDLEQLRADPRFHHILVELEASS